MINRISLYLYLSMHAIDERDTKNRGRDKIFTRTHWNPCSTSAKLSMFHFEINSIEVLLYLFISLR